MKFKTGKLPILLKDRMEYLYSLHKKLELYHNFVGAKVKAGEMTLLAFRAFQNNWYEPRSRLIRLEILHCRVEFAKKDVSEITDIEET